MRIMEGVFLCILSPQLESYFSSYQSLLCRMTVLNSNKREKMLIQQNVVLDMNFTWCASHLYHSLRIRVPSYVFMLSFSLFLWRNLSNSCKYADEV